MLFDVPAATNLVIWIVFVLWDPLAIKRKVYEAYAEMQRKMWDAKEAMPMSWYWMRNLFFDAIKITFIYLFLHFHVDFNSHFFITVYVLFVVSELVSKTVDHALMRMRNMWLGWFLTFFLMACSVARLGLVAHSQNVGVFTGTPDHIWILFVVLEAVHLLYLTYLTVIRCPYFFRTFQRWGKNRSWFSAYEPFIEAESTELRSTPQPMKMRHGWKKQ